MHLCWKTTTSALTILTTLGVGALMAAPKVSDPAHRATLPDLQPAPETAFLKKRRALSLDVSESDDRAAALVALARFYLNHALFPEARGVLGQVSIDRLPGDVASSFVQVKTILALLDNETTLDLDAFAPDATALWQAIASLNDPNGTLRADQIGAALPGLNQLPSPLQATFLPRLWEAALDLGAGALPQIRTLATRADALLLPPDLSTYLKGRTAQAEGDPATAARLYLEISERSSRAAAQSRLALARLWLAADRPDYDGARTLLESHLRDWRGDAVELDLYALLARIYEEIAALPEAVGVFGRVLSRFPDSPVAVLAETRAKALLPRLYDAGFSGQIGLPEFLEHHTQNLRLYDDHPVFRQSRAQMAHWLRQQGASHAAAQEFAALSHLPEIGQAVTLREAEALLYGGQAQAAWDVLTTLPQDEDADVEDHRRRLLVRAAILLGPPPQTSLPRPKNAVANDLREHAALLRVQANPKEAASTLTELTQTHQSEVTQSDAVHLFLAARQSDQPDTASVAASWMKPDADDRRLADTILAAEPDFSVLRLRETRDQLVQTQAVLDMAGALATPTENPDNSTDLAETNRN